jgi:hypothetical protein
MPIIRCTFRRKEVDTAQSGGNKNVGLGAKAGADRKSMARRPH